MLLFFVRYRSEYLNKSTVEAQFRGDLNDYGSFCIAIPLRQITAIAGTLYESNLEWQRRAKLDPRAPRCLNVRQTVGSPHGMQPYVSPR